MSDDFTPSMEQIRSHYVFDQSDRWDPERGVAFDRWLAAHDVEVRASVLAEQGEPEREFRISDGEFIHYTQSKSRVARALQRGLDVRVRVPGVPAVPAGPWLPVEENKPETMTACCPVSEPCEKHKDARHQEVPESTDGSER